MIKSCNPATPCHLHEVVIFSVLPLCHAVKAFLLYCLIIHLEGKEPSKKWLAFFSPFFKAIPLHSPVSSPSTGKTLITASILFPSRVFHLFFAVFSFLVVMVVPFVLFSHFSTRFSKRDYLTLVVGGGRFVLWVQIFYFLSSDGPSHPHPGFHRPHLRVF